MPLVLAVRQRYSHQVQCGELIILPPGSLCSIPFTFATICTYSAVLPLPPLRAACPRPVPESYSATCSFAAHSPGSNATLSPATVAGNTYGPNSNLCLSGVMDTRPTNVDDSDFSAIHYATNESWNHRQDQSHLQGVTFTEGFTNARAELRFNGGFPPTVDFYITCSETLSGTSVTVYGIATPRPSVNRTAVPPSVVFSVDDGIPTTVVGDPGAQNGETAHQFYLSPALPPREHILQINVTYGEEDWPFVLDYIQYVPSTESGAASGWGPTEGGLSAAAPKHPGAPVASIVGSVMGCLALLGAAVLLRFYWCFRKGSTKTKKRGSYIYISAATKVDLLDNGTYPRTVWFGCRCRPILFCQSPSFFHHLEPLQQSRQRTLSLRSLRARCATTVVPRA